MKCFFYSIVMLLSSSMYTYAVDVQPLNVLPPNCRYIPPVWYQTTPGVECISYNHATGRNEISVSYPPYPLYNQYYMPDFIRRDLNYRNNWVEWDMNNRHVWETQNFEFYKQYMNSWYNGNVPEPVQQGIHDREKWLTDTQKYQTEWFNTNRFPPSVDSSKHE